MGVSLQQEPDTSATSATADFPWANLRIPPFPQSALRVLQSVGHEDKSMRYFNDLICSDPALSCEVLIIANSALLAQRHRVTSIQQAIVLLGTRTLRGICLTVAVRSCLGNAMDRAAVRAVWQHSLACGIIAEQLADTATLDQGTAYTAGVMHEIGRFALALLRPGEYACLLETYHGPSASMLNRERLLFGFDHRAAGRHLVAEWKLPAEFAIMLLPPTVPPIATDLSSLHHLIRLSCALADTAGFPAFPGCEITPYAELLERIPVRQRSLFHADAARLAFDTATKIAAIDSI